MTNTLQQAMANILFNKLMMSFDDLENLSAVQSSNEYRIVVELSKKLEQEEISSDTTSCVDYELVINAWNTLYEGIQALSKDYKALLEKLLDLYNLRIKDPFQLFGSLIKHDTKVINKLGEGDRKIFKEYVIHGNKIIRDFRVSLLTYHSSELVDRFLDDIDIINKENIHYKSIELNGTSIYLDQNAVSFIVDHPQCMRQCLAGQENNDIAFVYSSYLIEDSINMNPLFLEEFLDNLLKITKNQMVATMDDGICFATESIRQTIDRVKKYSKLTKKFETHRFIKVIQHYHDYPELRKGKVLYNELGKDPIKFFLKETKSDIPGYELVEKAFRGNELITNFIKTGKIRETSQQEKSQFIGDMLELFDFINFETEAVKLTNAQKIYSSYRDNEHLVHASITDYLVTDDKRLKIRGNIIYPLIGAKTKVINSKEFSDLLPRLLS